MGNKLPTLRDLCRSLGDDLAPLLPAVAPRAEVTAVHVSELADPTPFLDGGELLLTTGLGFQPSPAGEPPSVLWFGGYVQRLVSRGVSGLAVGVGPVNPAVPEGLIDAASRAGLPLLVIPAPTGRRHGRVGGAPGTGRAAARRVARRPAGRRARPARSGPAAERGGRAHLDLAAAW